MNVQTAVEHSVQSKQGTRKTMSKVEDLFPALRGLKVEPKKDTPIRQGNREEPDALVLVRIEYDCVCGAHYTAPNRNMLLRFGKNYQRIKEWFDKYNNIKKERLVRREEIKGCEKCFNNAHWDHTILDVKQGVIETEEEGNE